MDMTFWKSCAQQGEKTEGGVGWGGGRVDGKNATAVQRMYPFLRIRNRSMPDFVSISDSLYTV
jgi:hypothetical protein